MPGGADQAGPRAGALRPMLIVFRRTLSPASSHTLPAFSQSSLFVIVEPGPANAGERDCESHRKNGNERFHGRFLPYARTKLRSLNTF